jgi:hypothetical protein
MTSTVVTYKAHATGIEAIFDRHLETSSAGIFFHNRDEVHARRVLEILELATQLVAQRLPHSIEKVTAYLYGSDDEMAQGLTTTLGYTPMEVKAVLKVGISEQSKNTLHLHPKTAKWGSVLSHVIVDEHTHGVIQNKYGTGPARSATWIEEGLTSYLAHEVLADTLEDFEDTYPERRFKIAFKALIFGKLPALADVSTRNQWYSNINESDDAWNNEYALAYFSVSHIASNYGFESILNILSDVKKGLPYKDSLERVTGITLADFEHNMRVSLFYTGIFHLYIKYTVLILLSLTVIFLISVYCIREIRRRNRMGAEA